MERIRLHFKGLSEFVGNSKILLVNFTDEEETRQFTVLCDNAAAEIIKSYVTGERKTSESLVGILSIMLKSRSVHPTILINSVVNGHYTALLCDENSYELHKLDIYDALVMAFAGNVPVYIESTLFMRQGVAYQEGRSMLAIPVNVLNNEILGKALKKAIADENYELASQLKEEQKRRKADETSAE